MPHLQVVLGSSGSWLQWVWVLGEVCMVLSEGCFLMLLLLLARGWAVTTTTGHHTPALYVLWALYTTATLVLYCWNKVACSTAGTR